MAKEAGSARYDLTKVYISKLLLVKKAKTAINALKTNRIVLIPMYKNKGLPERNTLKIKSLKILLFIQCIKSVVLVFPDFNQYKTNQSATQMGVMRN